MTHSALIRIQAQQVRAPIIVRRGKHFVEPPLHNWYWAKDAVAAFGTAERAEWFCDGQFVVLPSVVLCFVTVGQTFERTANMAAETRHQASWSGRQ